MGCRFATFLDLMSFARHLEYNKAASHSSVLSAVFHSLVSLLSLRRAVCKTRCIKKPSYATPGVQPLAGRSLSDLPHWRSFLHKRLHWFTRVASPIRRQRSPRCDSHGIRLRRARPNNRECFSASETPRSAKSFRGRLQHSEAKP